MKPTHRVSRRSFLLRVAGAGAVSGSSLGLVSAKALAFQITDSDPGDPVGRGRGGGTRITDSDPTDAGGRGRGPNAPRTNTGISDSDPSDPVGGGRGNRAGQNVNPRASTGVTDSDTGANRDPVGSGRGSGPVRNQHQQTCDANRARAQAIQQQLTQFSTDAQIDEAGRSRDWLATVANPTGDPEDRMRTSWEERAGPSREGRGIAGICQQYGIQCPYGGSDLDRAAMVQVQLQARIDQALAQRPQRQALERELHSLQQRIAYCR